MGLEDLLVSLRTGLEESQPSLIVLDSISSIEHSSSEKGFRQFMIGLAALLREHGRSALLTQTVMGTEATTHTAPYLSTIADAILALDYKVEAEDLQRSLRVLKMRGSAHVTKPYHLAIEQGGLRVEPAAITRRFDQWGTSPRKPWGGRAGSAPLSGLLVLLVEDFTDARETTAAALLAGGAEVVEASSAQEAMGMLQTHTPDVIVCDIGMPEGTGIRSSGGSGRAPARRGRSPRPPSPHGPNRRIATRRSRPASRSISLSRSSRMRWSRRWCTWPDGRAREGAHRPSAGVRRWRRSSWSGDRRPPPRS
jgi:hypothetical protein